MCLNIYIYRIVWENSYGIFSMTAASLVKPQLIKKKLNINNWILIRIMIAWFIVILSRAYLKYFFIVFILKFVQWWNFLIELLSVLHHVRQTSISLNVRRQYCWYTVQILFQIISVHRKEKRIFHVNIK